MLKHHSLIFINKQSKGKKQKLIKQNRTDIYEIFFCLVVGLNSL